MISISSIINPEVALGACLFHDCFEAPTALPAKAVTMPTENNILIDEVAGGGENDGVATARFRLLFPFGKHQDRVSAIL